jgi:hypothetical protein
MHGFTVHAPALALASSADDEGKQAAHAAAREHRWPRLGAKRSSRPSTLMLDAVPGAWFVPASVR